MSERRVGTYLRGNWEEIPGTDVSNKTTIGGLSQNILRNIISDVLGKSGRTPLLREPEQDKDTGRQSQVLYAHPPFESPEEALETAHEISGLWQQELVDIGDTITPHIDTFVPRID